MERHEFAEHVGNLLKANKWEEVLGLIHGIGLPEGWESMIEPIFETYLGREVTSEFVSAEEITEQQQAWLERAPEDLREKMQGAVRLSYEVVRSEDDKEREILLLPTILLDGRFRFLLVGGEGD